MAMSIEELSYQLTADALAEQERSLSGLRTRAGTVLAAASISGSFLGAKANHGSLDVFAILTLGAFVLCLASAIWNRDRIETLSNWLTVSCGSVGSKK